MKRYNSCDINDMSFREIIEELFSFKKVSKFVNPFRVSKMVLGDFNENAWTENEGMCYELDINYSYNENKNVNIIQFIDSVTGELLMIIEQRPNMLPSSERRWNYEITYSSWDFNHSFKISCGFGVLMGEE